MNLGKFLRHVLAETDIDLDFNIILQKGCTPINVPIDSVMFPYTICRMLLITPI